MPQAILNLGILAHVDAGKTTLTERLLYCAGVIDEPGSVDEGTTQTDSLALERQRGITIKSAVASFTVDGTCVNLIDTPGHPDFVAEVERALSVLDGVVLVVSAVEGVQPQTRILWRALQRLRIPALFFVNKIDRRGAGDERLLGDIGERLTPAIVPMGAVSGLGTREAAFIPDNGASPAATSRLAEVLAEHDDAVLAAYLMTGRSQQAAGSIASWPDRSGTCSCTRCSSGRPSRARAWIPCCTGSPACCPRRAAMPAGRYPAGSSRLTAGPPATRSPMPACSPAASRSVTGCLSGRR